MLDFYSNKIKPADFGSRFLAICIDAFIISIISGMVLVNSIDSLLGTGLLLWKVNDRTMLFGLLFYVIGFPVVIILYQSFFEASKFQGTLGKRVMKIKVIDYRGGRASFFSCFIRNLSKIISSVLMIGYLVALFTENKQTLHDIISNTYVVENE